MSSIARFVTVPIAVCLGAAGLYAQSTQTPLPNEKPAVFDGKPNPKPDKSHIRNLSGVVRDKSGDPISGAVVQLKNSKTSEVIDFITKTDGSYRFDDLDMNIDYDLTAKRDGYGDPVTKKLSKYDSRKPAILNFELQRGRKS